MIPAQSPLGGLTLFLPPFHDFLVCGITTQLTNRVASLDEVIAENDEDFPKAGLKAASLIRTACLALLPQSRFQGRLALSRRSGTGGSRTPWRRFSAKRPSGPRTPAGQVVFKAISSRPRLTRCRLP